MTKLVYPNNGIYVKSRDNFDIICQQLSSAAAQAVFNVPSDFTYKNYLNGLDNKLNKYSNDANKIKSALKTVSTNYENLETELNEEAKKMTVIKIKERDRMIV